MGKPVMVDVKPELLRWALERSRKTIPELSRGKTRNLQSWLDQQSKPTRRQLEEFAKRTYVPFGYLLLDEPPELTLSCPGPANPSGPLVDFTHHVGWFCHSMRVVHAHNDVEPPPFVGRYGDPAGATVAVRRVFGAEGAAWRGFAVSLREHAEKKHVTVLAPKRHRGAVLDASEFAGVVRADVMAPVVAVNGNAAGPVQLFALYTGLALVLEGASGVVTPDGMGRYGEPAGSPRRVPAGLPHTHGASRSPMRWPPVSDGLATKIFNATDSVALTRRDAWDLVGVKAFRAAEARGGWRSSASRA